MERTRHDEVQRDYIFFVFYTVSIYINRHIDSRAGNMAGCNFDNAGIFDGMDDNYVPVAVGDMVGFQKRDPIDAYAQCKIGVS